MNKLSNKVGAGAFWPTSLDKECDKGARILRSLCKDGFYVDERTGPMAGEEEERQRREGEKKEKREVCRPRRKQQVFKKIPAGRIRRARGLAIFTTMRTGLWNSGAHGRRALESTVRHRAAHGRGLAFWAAPTYTTASPSSHHQGRRRRCRRGRRPQSRGETELDAPVADAPEPDPDLGPEHGLGQATCAQNLPPSAFARRPHGLACVTDRTTRTNAPAPDLPPAPWSGRRGAGRQARIVGGSRCKMRKCLILRRIYASSFPR